MIHFSNLHRHTEVMASGISMFDVQTSVCYNTRH